MGRRVFNTFGASDDELDGLRKALHEASIEFYETYAGFWGVGTPAIWIHDASQFDIARQVISDFEQARNQSLFVDNRPYLAQVNWKLIPLLFLLIAAVIWMCLAFFRFV